eukprot:GHVS01011829.1.p1 GENE.GHVS01011829.1~~GHVS01011829.1.p1  ORF type:complete len:264 (+),score=72.50 GHVS01011829.1:158-949(+)
MSSSLLLLRTQPPTCRAAAGIAGYYTTHSTTTTTSSWGSSSMCRLYSGGSSSMCRVCYGGSMCRVCCGGGMCGVCCGMCGGGVSLRSSRLFSSKSCSSSSFDVFKKMSDPKEEGGDKKRKPSDRVLNLVDDIMCLSLIEAADLCDLCQEKLSERSGAPVFASAGTSIPGRTPFPHPMAMFSGMMGGVGMGGGGGMMPPVAAPVVSPTGEPVEAATAAGPVDTPASIKLFVLNYVTFSLCVFESCVRCLYTSVCVCALLCCCPY